MKTSLFYLPDVGTAEERQQGMAGMRGDLYQRMLHDISDQAKLADELGYNSISFTEHHFHIEGFEMSNNPVLLNLYIGMQTKQIRVGQLGIVLPAANPLRVAEDIAMLDHMTGGRANAGFARGYQRRWVDVLGQHAHGVHGALPDQHDAIDQANRNAFEENFRLVKRAWTEEMIEGYQGKLWQIPIPSTDWPPRASAEMGKGVEDGKITAIGVVPKPLQKPHPPIFQPFATSERSMRWCAQEEITAIVPPVHEKLENMLLDMYADESGKKRGDGVAFLRDLIICDTDHEARDVWERSSRWSSEKWFVDFGFRQGMKDPDTGVFPDIEEVLSNGYALVGSEDTVCRQLEVLANRLPLNWLFCWMFSGLIDNEQNKRSLDRYMTKILPRVGLDNAL
ncbi:MAG: LLM class flavin-dependent oxidoreductase [Alphaproteobacteria bacterium]|jgi:alkanesulfonate monooxygenase SsuD/methylene tetrahydromethanopterin reductase-like flavin-dependent oxidoreductase (luciferase family)